MHYAYDFNYSVQLEHFPQPNPSDPQQHPTISQCISDFHQADLLLTASTREFVSLLLRQPIFARLSSLLFRLAQI